MLYDLLLAYFNYSLSNYLPIKCILFNTDLLRREYLDSLTYFSIMVVNSLVRRHAVNPLGE